LLGDGAAERSFKAVLTAAANVTMLTERLDSGALARAGLGTEVRDTQESECTLSARQAIHRAPDERIR